MPSVNTIMLIFALAALGILALSTLVGFLAGLKRELKLTVVFVVLLGLVWLLLGNASNTLDASLPSFATEMLRNVLSGAFQNVTIGEFSTLRELVAEIVGGLASESLPALSELLVEGTKTYQFVMSIVEFAVRFVLVFVGTIVVYLLFIIVRIISFIIGSIYRLCTIRGRRRKRELREAKRETGLEEGVVVVKSDVYDGEVVVTVSRNPKKIRKGKRRGWAAGLGLLRGAFTVLLICVPITGLLSIVNEVEPETVDMVLDIMGGSEQNNGLVAEEESNGTLEWIFDFAEAYESGIVAEIISSSEYFLGKGLDESLFDSLFKIETSTQTIYLREEIIKLVELANLLPDAYDPNKSIPIDIWSLSDVKQDRIIEILKDFKLFYEVLPIAVEFAGSLDMVKEILEPSGQTLDGLSDVDWSHDLPLILDAVRNAIELGDFTEESFDVLALDSDVLREVVANIGATDFITKLMPIVINAALYLELGEGDAKFEMSDLIGEWPSDNVINTDGIVWENEFVNLVDIYALFQELELDLSNIDINALLANKKQMDIVNEMLVLLVTSDLFLDVAVEILDVAKEFQLGELKFEEFKNILKLVNLAAEDWESDINTLIDMVSIVQELGVLSEEGIDFYNYDAIRELVTKLFDLMIISNKAGVNYNQPVASAEDEAVKQVFNEVKTLLVEAALRQFDVFDVEGEFVFTQFTDEERAAINWENEKQMILDVLDVYEELMEFLKTKDITFDNIGEKAMELLNYDQTFDYLIDLLDALVDSDLAMTIIPYALDKFLVPIIEDFEDQAGLPDGDNIDITDQINKDNLSEEIFNLIYILMDARELGLVSVVNGELELNLGAYAYNPDSASFKEMSEKLGYAPAADDLALVDIINRIFNSKLFDGKEAKLIRVLLAVFLDTRVSKTAIYAIEFGDPAIETSERNILISALNGLKPILTDPEFSLFNDEGEINLDYFLDQEIALDVIDSVRKLFTSELIEVILPELYNQYLIPQGMIPEDFVEIFDVQSLYLAEHNQDESYLDGLTGEQLTQDIVTILSIAELLIDFEVLNYFDEEEDILFADATDTFNRLFDLILQLNVLRNNGDKLASVLVKMILEVEIPAEDFAALNVNWYDEVQGVKEIVASVFALLINSNINGYHKLLDVVDAPMDYLVDFLVDENVAELADILTKVSESKVLELLALPLVNKYVPTLVEGIGPFTEEEYAGQLIAEDILALANILNNVAEAKLMATIKAILGEFTDLIPEQDTDVVIPLRHDLYAEIVEELFGLNALQILSVKEYLVSTIKDMLTDMDLSSVDAEYLDFAGDGQLLADAYREFAQAFSQEEFETLTVADILAFVNGEKDPLELLEIVTKDNLVAIIDLLEAVFETTLVHELGLVGINFAKGALPENLAFILDVTLKEDQVVEDLNAVITILRSIVNILDNAINEITSNLSGILDGSVNILDLELAYNLNGLLENAETIAHTLDNMNIINGRGKAIVSGVFQMLEVNVTEEDLANVVWKEEFKNAKLAVTKIVEFLIDNELNSLSAIMSLTENLSLENTSLINTKNVLVILDVVEIVLNSEFLKSIIGPVYDKFLADTVAGSLPEGVQAIIEFNEEYTARNLVEDLTTIINGLQSIVSFGVIEFINAEGELDWSQINLVSSGLEEIFTIQLLETREIEILNYVAEMASLELVSVTDIDWVQTGEKLAATINGIGKALELANAFNTLAGLETLDVKAFLTDGILTEVINALDELVDMSLLEALMPTVVNYVATSGMLPDSINELLLLEGLTNNDYKEDLNTFVSILADINAMGIAGIVENVMDGTTDAITWKNLGNIAVVLEKVLKLNFWDNKQLEVVELIVDVLGVDRTNIDIASLNFAEENANLISILKELLTLVDELGINSVSAVNDLVDSLSDSVKLAEVINKVLVTLSNVFDGLANSGYVRLLAAPMYQTFIQSAIENLVATLFGEDNKSLASLDYYIENPMALSNDLALISDFFEHLYKTGLVDFVLVPGTAINFEDARELATAIEKIFSLEILTSKEDVIVNIISGLSSDVELSDGRIDFSEDGIAFAEIIRDVLDFLNSGVITITTLDSLNEALSNINFELLLTGSEPSVKFVFSILKEIGELSFLDEVFAVANLIIVKNITLPEGLEFVLEFGPNGAPGLVQDYLDIIDAIEGIFELGFADFLILNEDVNLYFADAVSAFVRTIFELDFLDGKGDKLIEFLANSIDYPELKEILPLDWNEEYQAFETIIYNLEGILFESEFFTTGDIVNFINNITSVQDILDLLTPRTISMLKGIVKSVADSIVVQATIGVSLYVLLPVVESALPEVMKPLVHLDDITIAEIIEDIDSLVAIVANIDNFNLFEAILFAEDFDYEASAYVDSSKYALSEAFELLFGLNYLNAKLDTIGEILISMDPMFESINFEFLLEQAAVRTVGMTNFAYDGVILGSMYNVLVDKVFTDPKWSYNALSDFNTIKLFDFYSKDIINGFLEAFETLLSLNTIEAAMPFVYELVGNSFVGSEIEFIIDYILETPADLLQDDIVTIIGAFKAIANNHDFVYEDELKEALQSGLNLSKLNFNLSMIEALPEILDDLSKLNVLSSIKGERLVEIVKYVLDTVMPEFDYSNVDWDRFSTVFDYLDSDSEALTSLVQIFDILAGIISEDINYTEFKPLYNDLMNIRISKNENLLNADVAHSVLDILDIIVNSTTLSSFFYAVYDNFLAATVESMGSPVVDLLDVYAYESVLDLQADLTAIINIVRELVDFDVLGIVLFDRDIEWTNTTPIENIFKHLFGLNYLNHEVGLQKIVDFVTTNVFDLSELDVESVSNGLLGDADLIAQAYQIIALNVLAKEEFPIHNLADLQNFEIVLADYLNATVLNKVVDAAELVLSTNLVYEVLPILLDYAKGLVPEEFAFILETELTKEELQSDVITLLDVVRTAIDMEAYNILLEKGIPLVGIGTHLENIVKTLVSTNILSKDVDNLVINVFELLGIELTVEDLASVDYAADLENIYEIFQSVETILTNAKFEDHNDILALVENLNVEELLNNEDLVNNANLYEILNMVESILDLSLVLAIFEPAYNAYVPELTASLDSQLQPLLDISEYPAELFVADAKSLVDVLRQLVDFNVLAIYKGSEIDWTNTTPIENIINTIFGLNYLNVKLDDIVTYVSNNIFDLSEIDVESVRNGLVNDGAMIAEAYRILATEIFALEVFPVHYLSDIESLNLDYTAFLTNEILHSAVDAIEIVLSTNLVYEALPILYSLAQYNVPDDLFFLVANSLTKDELQADVLSLIDIIRQLVDAEVYNIVLEKAIPLTGISQRLETIIDILVHTNILSKNPDNLVVNALGLANINIYESDLVNVDYNGDLENIYAILSAVEAILVRMEIEDHEQLLSFVQNLNVSELLEDEKVLNGDNLYSLLDIIENIIDLSLIPVIFEPAYNAYVPELTAGLDPQLQPLLDISEYPAEMFVADAKSLVYILRQAVEFGALGIYQGAEIDWTNTTPIENIINTIFGLNYLNVKLDDIVTYVSENIIDLSELDVESVRNGLVNDGAMIAEAYRILATEIFALEVFPVHYLSDIESLNLDYTAFLTNEILHSAVDAIEIVLSTNLVYEALPILYSLAQTIIPDDLYFVVSNTLSKDQLFSDVHAIIAVLREVIELEVYNYLLEDQAISLVGIGDSLEEIVNLIVHTNIVSTNPNVFVSGVLNLFDIQVSAEQLTNVDYAADLEKIYSIFDMIEDILIQSELDDHLKLLEFVNTLDVSTILENETLVSNSNLHNVLDILENVVDLSLLLAIFEPVYNKFVDLNSLDPQLQPLLDISNYGVELLVADAKALIGALRSLVDFDVLGIIRGYAIDWDNIEAIENVINTIFGLNYLNVKLDAIVTYVSENIFDLTGLDVESVRNGLVNDGAMIAEAYRILAENILAQNWFPIQYLSDLESLSLDTLPLDKILVETVLTSVVDAIENILSTNLVYEVLPIMYGYAQTIVPDDLYFLVASSLTKDELQADVLSIVTILREAVDTEIYNYVHGIAVPIEGLADKVVNIISTIFGLNLIADRLNDLLYNIFTLAGINVDYVLLNEIDINGDLDKIYNVLYNIEDILLNSNLNYDQDIIEFLASIEDINSITTNEAILNNTNLISLLDALDSIVGLDLLLVVFEPVYNMLIDVNSFDPQIQPFLDLSEYPAEMLVQDLQAIISVLRNIVNFDVLGVLRGNAIDWENIEAVENVINAIFGLNYLNVKLDDIVTYVSNNVFDLTGLDANGIDLVSDGAKIAAAYRMIAENVLTQNWFPIQYLSDLEESQLDLTNVLTIDVLNIFVDALNEVLTTSLVYEVLPVLYNAAQTIVPDDLYFLVSNSLSKDELAEDVQSIILVLREVIAAEVHNVLLNKGIEIEGMADHIAVIIDTLLHTNILGKDLSTLVSGLFNLLGIEVTKDALSSVDFDNDLGKIYSALNNIEDILLNSGFVVHFDIIEFMNNLTDIEIITSDENILSNENVILLVEALEHIVGLDLLLVVFEPVYNKFIDVNSFDPQLQPFFDISEYPAEMFVQDLQALLSVVRNAVDFDVLGVLRGKEINWENIEAVENVINAIFGLNYLNVKLDDIVTYVSNNVFDLSELDVESLRNGLASDGAKIAAAYRMIAENVLVQDWFPIQVFNDIYSAKLNMKNILTQNVLNALVDALNEILTTNVVYELTPISYEYVQTIVPDSLYFLVSNELSKDELAEDVQSIILVLREVIAAEIYNDLIGKGIPVEGLAAHVSTMIDALVHTNILGKDLAKVFEGVFNLFGVEVPYSDLAMVDYEHDFTNVYGVLENIEDILLKATFNTHLDILQFARTFSSINDLTSDENILNNNNLYELIDSLELLVGLDIINAIYEPVYNKMIVVESLTPIYQPFFDISNYGVDLFVEDAHALVYALRNLVDFDVLGIVMGYDINWAYTEPIENVITTLFGLNYIEVKLADFIDLINVNGINTSLIDVELLKANLEADGVQFALAYRELALQVLALENFPAQTKDELLTLSLEELKAFFTKDTAHAVIDIVEPLVDTTLVGELLVVAYDYAQTIISDSLYFLVSQALTKDELRSDAKDILNIVRISIDSELIKLALGEDVELAGISAPVNAIIEILAHTNIFGNDLAKVFEGLFKLIGVEVSYDELTTVDYEHDLAIIYTIVEEIEAVLLNSNATTVKGAYEMLKGAVASGRAVLRDKELVNDANALAVLDIIEQMLDLELMTVVAEPLYEKVMDRIVTTYGLPEALADTTRYDYNDFIGDVRIGIDSLREAIAFGVISMYQDDALIEWSNTTPVKNIIINVFATEFLNEFDYELIEFVGNKLGYDLVSNVDVDSIDWVADSTIFAEAYELVALGILNDSEFTIKRLSDIRTFEFNYKDYAKQRYALAAIDALDLCVDTTLFDAYGLEVLRFANNYLPESLQFVINETTITKPELRSDAHAGLYLAKLAINEGFGTLVTEKDCDIIKPDFYKEAIKVLFDLNIVADSNVRVRIINVVLEYLGLEAIDSITDWDQEEEAYINLVDAVCEFLIDNDLDTAKKLYAFLVNREFISGSFLTDENILEILDIMEDALASEVVTKVSANVYSKVVERIPYESVVNLVAFGDGARDYNKEAFYNDLPALIDLARDIVNMKALDYFRNGDWEIVEASAINALLDKVFALELFEGRLDLFADVAFNALGVEVDLTNIDWENEIDVLQSVIAIALPALQESGLVMISDAKALVTEILDNPVTFVKTNRDYVNLENAYVVLDVLEELELSEVYMRALLKVYNRYSHKLPNVVTNNIDLSTYPEAELRADYSDIIEIVRYALDGKLYKVITEKRDWEFPVEAVTALENIIALGSELNFTARYTEGVIRLVADVLGISILPSNLDQINLAEDKDELVSIVSSLREIWIGTNHVRPNIPMLANKELFVEISYVLDILLDTTLFEVFVPWTYDQYVVEIINALPTLEGRVDYSKLQSYSGSEVMTLAEDGLVVLNELIAMNVFGTTGIDFTDNSHVKNIVNILLKHVGFTTRIEDYLLKAAERSYLMGVIPVSYDQVTSTRSELAVIKEIAVDVLDLYRAYGSAILSRDFARLTDGSCEKMVLAVIEKLGDSVLLNTSFIPTLNGLGDVVIGPEHATIYEACQVSTIAEFKDAVAELFDILEKAEELGVLNKQVQYKNTEVIKQLVQLIENSPFIKGQEGVLVEFVLKYTDYIDHNEVDLININWANEYQYLYEFLDKANAPLNMNGIVITDYQSLINNTVFMKEFTEALKAFAPSEIMVELFMPVYEKFVATRFESISDLLDYSHLETLDDAAYATAIQNEYLKVLDAAVLVSELGILDGSEEINVNKLLALYDIAFSLEGTKNNKGDIFEKLSSRLPSFGSGELVIPADVNWDTEIPAIRGIFASLINFADVDGNINTNEISSIISESTDVKAFEELLTAINQSVIYRTQLFETLNSEINNVSPDGDIVISKYLTDWFKNQQENGMLGVAEWNQEMIYLARILTIVNYMRQNGGFTDLAHMNLGKDVTVDASTVTSSQFNVSEYGLKQLLQLMSASKSFTLTALNSDLEALLIDNAEHDGLIMTDKKLNALNDAEWDAEIDDLIRLIHNIQVLELLETDLSITEHIKLCTKAEIEELLVSFNHCDAVRDILPDMISETLDDSNGTEWKSEWLMNQVGVDAKGNNKPIASVAEWDAEAKELAAIITLIDNFDFNKEINAYTQAEIEDLRQLLHEMNHDKSLDVSYIIEFLNTNVLEKGLINTTKKLEKPTSWDMTKWDLELDNMVDVIEIAINSGLFASDSADALASMDQDEIESILEAINNSEIMRTVLPDLVYNAVKSAGQDSWLTTDKWLENQVGQTAGVNNSVASSTEWSTEIEKYALIISKSSSFDFANLDLSDNSKLDDLKEVMKAMNETKSFTLDPVVEIINDLLETNGYNVTLIGVNDGANKSSQNDANGNNKDEWATEIDVLFNIIELMNDLGTVTSSTLSSSSTQLGELLDTMKTSYLFGNDVRDDASVTTNDNIFNTLVIDVLTTSNIINNGTNGGFIDSDKAKNDDWSAYNWTSELSIISGYDGNATTQSDEFINKAQSSEIIKKYFDIAGELNKRLDVKFIILGTEYNLKDLVKEATGEEITNDNLAKRTWADELKDVNELTSAINECSDNGTITNISLFATKISNIKDNQTIAGQVANYIVEEILSKIPSIS